MRNKKKLLFFLLAAAGQFAFIKTFSQAKTNTGYAPATIIYDITITKRKHAGGIEETYNGGTKTIFVTNKNARIRLVTLMRIQSIFFDYALPGKRKITIVKESGKKKYKFNLTNAEWIAYNSKYDSANISCDFKDDTLTIAGYACKKVVINLQKTKQVTVFYTDSIKAVNSFIEPLFRCVPGLVLQYEVSSKKGSLIFKASRVSNSTISPDIFIAPSKGFAVKKYRPGKGKNNEDPESEDPGSEE